jgi:hypothetical protein
MKTIIKILFLFMLPVASVAQTGMQNTGTLYVSNSGDTIFVTGSFANASGSAFTNNGMLYVKQDLSNDQASMTAGTGRLYLNGTALQTVSGTQTFKTFDLITNNAAGFTLNNNLSVSGTHTFTSGMITTASTPKYMVYEAGSSYTGTNDSRHVFGWVKKFGNTNFTFPVGSASYERPVVLSNITSSSEYNVKYNSAPTPNYGSVYNPIVIVDTNEYWTINRASGTGAAQVTMNWNTSQVPFPVLQLTHIRATYWDGTFWRGIGGTGSGNVLTSGSVTSTSTNIFNTNFVIGSISHVLPLQIISFTASRTNHISKVNWTIANELNVDKYELLRSNDGLSYNTISVQNPVNSSGTEFYSYDDRSPISSTAYYRLKITGSDGKIAYSNIVAVTETNGGRDLYVITNPVDASIDIYADAYVKGTYNYTISNVAGQVMQSGILDIRYGGVHPIVLKPVFASGTYILVVRNAERTMQKTIIKK